MMDWKTLGKKLAGAGLAPLGGALGGPAGAVIGAQIAKTIGLPVGAGPAEIAQALNDPETMVRLAQIDAEADVKLAEIEVRDRADARANSRDDGMRRALALLLPLSALAFGTGLVLVLVRANEITQAVAIGSTILGWLLRDASTSSSFFFGTSVGSARRAAELAQERK